MVYRLERIGAVDTKSLDGMVMQWISVEERLPSSGEYVLIHDKFGYNQVAVYMEPEKCWYDAISVTHWMELPKPPKEEE